MLVREICKGAMNIYCHLVYKLDIKGKENIPKKGAVILCSNHVHLIDSISIVVLFRRLIHPMAKEELFKGKFMNWLMREVGAYPVKRGKGDIEAIETSEKFLAKGDALLIFPEGTRHGLLEGKKLKKGAALIALKTNTPIIPIGIEGDYKLFTKVKMRMGKPITLENYKTGKDFDTREVVELTKRLQDEIVALRDSD